MKVIEGKFRVLSEDGVPVKPVRHPARRFASRLPGPLRWLLLQPMFYWWVFAITLVGLTEGLW